MKLEGERLLLRFYFSAFEKHGHLPAYEALVEEARRSGLAGATVLRGIFGYSGSRPLATERDWSLGDDVPVTVEIVESAERAYPFLDRVAPLLAGRFVTLERARVVQYRATPRERESAP